METETKEYMKAMLWMLIVQFLCLHDDLPRCSFIRDEPNELLQSGAVKPGWSDEDFQIKGFSVPSLVLSQLLLPSLSQVGSDKG